MEDRAKILIIAKKLRACLGCAYGGCSSASDLLVAMLCKAGLKAVRVKGTFHTDLPVVTQFKVTRVSRFST
jgi:hypothetical protein